MANPDVANLLKALESKVQTGLFRLNEMQDSVTSVRKFFMAAYCHKLIREHQIVTKRDVYYSFRALFPTVDTVHRCRKALADELGIDPNDLLITQTPKGLMAGPLEFCDDDCQVSVDIFGQYSHIPVRPGRLRNVTTSARLLLVVEKECVFQNLVSAPEYRRLRPFCLTLTGVGFPDAATSRLVSLLTSKFSNIPVLCLTDCDPHGALIAIQYAKAMKSPHFSWIGCHHSQIGSSFSIPPQAKIQLSARENVVASNLVGRYRNIYPRITHQVQVMLDVGWKFEIEAILQLPGYDRSVPYSIVDFILSHLDGLL